MKVYEAARLLKVSNKEFLTEHNLKSHMSKLPADLEAELFGEEKKIQTGQAGAETVDRAETAVVTVEVEVVTEECPYTPEQITRSIRVLGSKSSAWKWRHLA